MTKQQSKCQGCEIFGIGELELGRWQGAWISGGEWRCWWRTHKKLDHFEAPTKGVKEPDRYEKAAADHQKWINAKKELKWF